MNVLKNKLLALIEKINKAIDDGMYTESLNSELIKSVESYNKKYNTDVRLEVVFVNLKTEDEKNTYTTYGRVKGSDIFSELFIHNLENDFDIYMNHDRLKYISETPTNFITVDGLNTISIKSEIILHGVDYKIFFIDLLKVFEIKPVGYK